jgi:hypothetical protein
MPGNYSVKVEVFAEKYFIKGFQRKHKAHWDITLRAITAELERIDMLLQTDRAVVICGDDIKIIKTKFKVVGTHESAKTSGNRCIVAWNKDKQVVNILLVYGKTDLSGNNETAQWKSLIKENYSEYKDLI